ncbi:NADH-quinone oxidoreductase subunit C [Streptacidiphilus fuscans]|uniref:NADH-quinone oxidoreductase subunit C n=1 Tax=Streptacidiphilus fuscans TaxID=2789292 RepID=A0A931B3I3_9ACTN|nr:NADH-quinone oxidoreductase subunit C [Streptacidiphilus fuscans]MBF9067977.1 NADH-quinone oxidoreductase subunit C [Streptacidiphilus fuscans]
MTILDRSAEEIAAAVGPWASAAEAYELVTVDVPAEHWTEALTTCRDQLGLAYFDWLSAVDELAEGFSVSAHLARVGDGTAAQHLLLRTRVPRDAASLPTAVPVFAGAAWHERETHEMFGIEFPGHPHLITLLLPDGFEGHPLRKEFVLAARVAKAWPGAKEPGESDHSPAEGGRRRMLPPGVPDPNEWGPLAGTLPPVPERPARGARAGAARGAGAAGAGGAAGAAADRPRRARSVAAGSASQTGETPAPAPVEETPAAPAPASPDAPWQSPDAASSPAAPTARPRRSRSVSAGSVSQQPEPEAVPEAEAEAAPETDAEAAPAPEAPKPEPRTDDSTTTPEEDA